MPDSTNSCAIDLMLQADAAMNRRDVDSWYEMTKQAVALQLEALKRYELAMAIIQEATAVVEESSQDSGWQP